MALPNAAEKKAEALFIQTAGQAAHDTLESEEGLPVRGSAGGDYLLHKKRSYCVTRVADGAKLCAVVPGVPLWDHLLGIKLTIEHDEPEFLRKANVAGGGPYHPDFNYGTVIDPREYLTGGSRYEHGRTIPKPVALLLGLTYSSDGIAHDTLRRLRRKC